MDLGRVTFDTNITRIVLLVVSEVFLLLDMCMNKVNYVLLMITVLLH